MTTWQRKLYESGDEFDALEDLTPQEKRFWQTFTASHPKEAARSLSYLAGMRHEAGPTSARIPTPPAALQTLSAFAGVGKYRTLYRGIEVPRRKHKVGEQYAYKSPRVSFWTQDRDWAEAFVDWGCNAIVIAMPFDPNVVLLDMNKVPYHLGPTGREPELLIKPGTYATKIVRVFTE